jgi:NAD(P)-dependent dehydrogenase (short-subunit alcohol dehydrogenase family)
VIQKRRKDDHSSRLKRDRFGGRRRRVLGSYLCGRLIAEGWRVICVDNLHTATVDNLSDLSRESRFSLIEADIARRLRANPMSRQAAPSIAPGMIRWSKNRFRSDGGVGLRRR